MLTCGGVFARYMYCTRIHMYSHAHTRYTCNTNAIHVFPAQPREYKYLRNTSSRYIAIQYRNTYHAYVLRRSTLYSSPWRYGAASSARATSPGMCATARPARATVRHASARTCSRSTTYSSTSTSVTSCTALARPTAPSLVLARAGCLTLSLLCSVQGLHVSPTRVMRSRNGCSSWGGREVTSYNDSEYTRILVY